MKDQKQIKYLRYKNKLKAKLTRLNYLFIKRKIKKNNFKYFNLNPSFIKLCNNLNWFELGIFKKLKYKSKLLENSYQANIIPMNNIAKSTNPNKLPYNFNESGIVLSNDIRDILKDKNFGIKNIYYKTNYLVNENKMSKTTLEINNEIYLKKINFSKTFLNSIFLF